MAVPELKVICYRDSMGEYIVVPTAENEGGWGLHIDRTQRLAKDAAPADIGSAIRAALESCDISLYDRTVGFPEAVAAREKTVGSFMKKWHAVYIKFSVDTVTIFPSRRDTGRQPSYKWLTDQRLLYSGDASNEVLGEAVRGALELCVDGKN